MPSSPTAWLSPAACSAADDMSRLDECSLLVEMDHPLSVGLPSILIVISYCYRLLRAIFMASQPIRISRDGDNTAFGQSWFSVVSRWLRPCLAGLAGQRRCLDGFS